MRFTLSFFVAALAAFAAASPIEQNTNVKNAVNQKCFSGCGPQGTASIGQATWGGGYVFGNQQYTSFTQLTQGFQSFGVICANTFSQWGSGGIQFQQISYEIHTMATQFQAMVTQFSTAGGCHICDQSYRYQFTSAITPVFQQFQSMITIITQSYSNYLPRFQPDFDILQSCLHVVVGILVSLNIDVSSLLSSIGIDFNIFAIIGINIPALLSLDVTHLFSGNGLLAPVGDVLHDVVGNLL